jgi:hypothetical protein
MGLEVRDEKTLKLGQEGRAKTFGQLLQEVAANGRRLP